MKKLYIVHGWSYNLDKWQPILPELKKRGFEPVLLKVPGLTSPSEEVWDMDGYIKWLHAQLADEDTPVVIGHSNGGRIALAFCQKYPDRLQRLILIDSAGVQPAIWQHVKTTSLYYLSKIGKPFAKIRPLRKIFYKVVGARDYYEAPENMRATMQNMLAANKHMDFAKITVPTTLIWGHDDRLTPLRDGRILHRRIDHSSLHVVDGAHHAPMFSHPGEVANLIADAVNGSDDGQL